MSRWDDVVIGAGMAGLSAAALLARSGRRVLVLEAHDAPGGYAHTFRVRDFRFCAQVHYIFGCGEGQTIHRFLDDVGIAGEIPWIRLDPDGFDHVIVGGDRVRIPSGLRTFEQRLVRRWPEAAGALRRYFAAVEGVGVELDRDDELPRRIDPISLARSALRYRHMLRWSRSTLADVYDAVGMPPRLRAILAGQSGDYLLPPEEVSFVLHVALVWGYDRGAYYPKKHFHHFVERVCDVIRESPGCELRLESPVARIHVEGRRVVGITTADGERHTADRYVSNVDPRATLELAGPEEPVGEPRSAVESTLDPIDLDQVDPERRNARERGHGVITAEVVESLPSG